MNWSDFANKKVGLLGAGKENLSLVPHLLKVGADIAICDQFPVMNAGDLGGKGIEIEVKPDWLEQLDQFDWVFRTPSLPLEVLYEALNKNEKKPGVTTPMNLFLSLSPCKIIGVTGTKGKGTTATMIGSILEAAGKRVIVAGNIGVPIFDYVDELKSDDVVVMELSSFQLEDLTVSPSIAVLLPITPNDHLQPLSDRNPNYHHSVEEYVLAKSQITAHQKADDTVFFATDWPLTLQAVAATQAKAIPVSSSSEAADYFVNDQGEVFHQQKLFFSAASAGITGAHNWLNATFAAAVAHAMECSTDQIIQGLKNFKPLPHRMQQVREKDSVLFIDDSFATAPDAAMAAIKSYKQPIVWIGGGSSKGAAFDELAKAISNSTVKEALLIGQEADKIAAALEEFSPKTPVLRCDTLNDAVNAAAKLAKSGEVVLLSPGCASKDMFRDATDRGDQFHVLVNEL